jgi:hypothetical protein
MIKIVLFSSVFIFLSGAAQLAHSEDQSIVLQVEPIEYKLDIAVDYESDEVSGICKVTVKNTSNTPAQYIPFLLYRLLVVTSVTDENLCDLNYKQSITPIKDWEAIEVNYLVISPDESLQPKECRTIIINYTGQLKGYSEQGWQYVKDHIDREFTYMRWDGYGYPVLAIPDDNVIHKFFNFRFDYTLNVTVPKDLVVANSGTLIGKEESGSTICYSYCSRKPSWRIDIAIADYGILKKDLNVVFYFKKDIDGADYIMNAMEKSIETYTNWFGPLKNYSGFSIIEVPKGYSGQADVAAIILPADNLTDSKTIETVYHEFSHMWNVRALDANPCRLEIEGLAQFLQTLLREEIDGEANLVDAAVKKHRDRFRAAVKKTPLFMSVPICDYGVNNMIDYSYSNGMVFFTVLYRLCGKDVFNRLIGSFQKKYSTTGAYLEDFTRHILENTSAVSNTFIQDWIYTPKATELITGTLSMIELINLYR